MIGGGSISDEAEGAFAEETVSADVFRVTLPPTDTSIGEEGDDTSRTIRVAATADQVEERTETLTLVM